MKRALLVLVAVLAACCSLPDSPIFPPPTPPSWTQEDYDFVGGLVEALGADVPLTASVLVRIGELDPGLAGTAEWLAGPGYFQITLAPAPRAFLAEVLTHEWAHCVVWDAPKEDAHGPLWGVAYARCYRTYEAYVRAWSTPEDE